jgi:hypothetical protein
VKRSRRLSGKIVLYVPDTFDPEALLPKGLRHLADYARYLADRGSFTPKGERRSTAGVPFVNPPRSPTRRGRRT